MIRTAQRVIFEGHVQGVGFRYCVRELAKGYDITGTIKNLPTGAVEMIACGEHSEFSNFIDGIKQSEVARHIKNTITTPTHEAPGEHLGFRIIS